MELSLWLEEILRKTQDRIELCWNSIITGETEDRRQGKIVRRG